jgi:hypothetical protein
VRPRHAVGTVACTRRGRVSYSLRRNGRDLGPEIDITGDFYVSRTVRDFLLGSDIEFDDRGTHDLKGIPGTWDILAVAQD